MEKDPLNPENMITKWFDISDDELDARMARYQALHNEPLEKAVAILDDALTKIMRELGVETNSDPESIRLQQEILGIHTNTMDIEKGKPFPGVFVTRTTVDGELEPYAWVSDAVLGSDGKFRYQIQWFTKGRMDETAGISVVH